MNSIGAFFQFVLVVGLMAGAGYLVYRQMQKDGDIK